MRKDLEINSLIIVIDMYRCSFTYMGQLDFYFYKRLCELSGEENNLYPVTIDVSHF